MDRYFEAYKHLLKDLAGEFFDFESIKEIYTAPGTAFVKTFRKKK